MKFDRLHQLVCEVAVPAVSYRLAMQYMINRGQALRKILGKLVDDIKKNAEDIEYNLSRYIVSNAESLGSRFLDPSDYGSLVRFIEQLEAFKRTVETTKDEEHARNIVWKYVPGEIERLAERMERMYEFQSLEEEATEFLHKDEESGGSYYTDEDRIILRQILEALARFHDFHKFILMLKPRFEAGSKWSYGDYYNSRNFRPDDLQKEEVAYHATINARGLKEHGFEGEVDNKYHLRDNGLGGSSMWGHISFTFDYTVAQSIMVVYKKLWLLIHEKWPISKMLDEVRAYTNPPMKDGSGIEYNFNEVVKQYERNKGHKGLPKNLDEAIDFYLVAMWFMNTHIHRNPVFSNTGSKAKIEQFKKIDLRDIGVIKARINTENAKEFLVGEREIRIPPEDVIEILSIIQ